MAASAEVWFDLMEGEDINDSVASADSSNTKKAIKFGVDVFVHIVEQLASILTNYPHYPIKIWTMF